MIYFLNKWALKLGNRFVEKVDSVISNGAIPCFKRLLSSKRFDLCMH